MRDDFHDQLIAALPRLRVQALALTRRRAAAEDLVQDATVNALARRESFAPGTNFAAWMRRILYNHFINTTRRRREIDSLEDAPQTALAVGAAAHEDRLVLRELVRALARLPADHREALFLTALRGMSYEQVAEANGWAVGMLRSRIFRARAQLRASLLGEDGGGVPLAGPPPPGNAAHLAAVGGRTNPRPAPSGAGQAAMRPAPRSGRTEAAPQSATSWRE